MRPSDDPFDARPTAELLATDALLDRVGARAPTPDDLDDPLVAALALMAAEIDLDAVPVESTRAALARALPDLDVPAATGPAEAPLHDRATGLVLDLRDRAPEPAASTAADALRGPRRRPRRTEPAGGPVAMAPPRSLARMPSSTGPGRSPQGRRERRLRPMAAVAVAVTAIILGSGVSAALTNGRSVNPLDGVQQVVARITGDRTADQTAARDEARRHLARAETFAERGQLGPARAEIDKATALLRRMTPEDATLIGKQAEALRKAIQ